MNGQDTNTIPIPIASVRTGDTVTQYGKKFRVSSISKSGSPILDMLPQTPVTHSGKWLANKMAGLYQDKDFQTATPEQQNFYKQRAYEKWVVPYYKHIGRPGPTLEAFLDPQKETTKNWKEVQRAEFWEKTHKQDWRNLFAAVSTTDKTISGISDILQFLTMNHGGVTTRTDPVTKRRVQVTVPSSENAVSSVFKRSQEYYDKQAQDMEDRIQDLGGHNLVTNMSSFIAQASLFEATGGAKASSYVKLANPRTANFGVQMLKASWNGVVTDLFWSSTTGSKHDELLSPTGTSIFIGFEAAGPIGSKLSKFLQSFSGTASKEVLQQTIKDAADGLLKGGVSKPKQQGFDVNKYEDNKKAATAGVSMSLNMLAALRNTKDVLKAENVNGAFKKLKPAQQKEVVSRLFMMLSQSQDVSFDNLATQLGPQYVKEAEENVAKVVPKVAKQVQESVNGFVKKRMPQATEEDIARTKLGAILPHHKTTDTSPIAHVSARISWLTNMLKNEDLIMSERDALRQALQEERVLYNRIKDAKVIKMSRLAEYQRDLAKETDPVKRADIEHAIEREKAFIKGEKGPGRGRDE